MPRRGFTLSELRACSPGMSQSERRIQRIAVGVAVLALIVAVSAVIVTWRTDRRSDVPESRHVSARDLVKLKPSVLAQAVGGIRVTDAELCHALGLSPDDTIAAISGRAIARAQELSGVLRDLAALRARSWFVDVVRDREPVLVRWELDGDLDAERRADLAARLAGAAPGGQGDPRIASVRQVNPTTFVVPRATFEAWTADPAQVTAGGRAIPVVDAGEQGGFRLYAIRRGSVYAALGLEDGDVLRAINGTQLASGDQALELIARSTAQITLDLLRRGRPMILNYLIK